MSDVGIFCCTNDIRLLFYWRVVVNLTCICRGLGSSTRLSLHTLLHKYMQKKNMHTVLLTYVYIMYNAKYIVRRKNINIYMIWNGSKLKHKIKWELVLWLYSTWFLSSLCFNFFIFLLNWCSVFLTLYTNFKIVFV